MIFRINLLKPSECRTIGLVSRKFVIRSASIGTGGAAFLFVVFFAMRYLAISQDYAWQQTRWAKTEAQFKTLAKAQDEWTAISAVLGELDGWNKARLPWHRFLQDLRDVTPSAMQFTQLTGMMQWEMVKSEAPPPPETPPATKEEGGLEAPPPPPSKGDPALRMQLSLNGRAKGELADSTVVQFVQLLNENAALHTQIEQARLQSIQSDASARIRRETVRVFRIEATGPVRKLE